MLIRSLLSLALVVGLAGFASAENLDIGDAAPAIEAIGTDGEEYTWDDAKDAKVIVVCFTCNKCPVAVAYEDRFIEFAQQYEEQDVVFVAINVNVTESMDEMRARVEEKGFPFPYVQDESGESAHAFGARVTPHLFILDEDRTLAYAGAFDNNMDASRVTENYVHDAVDALLAGEPVERTETRPVGCQIRPRSR